MSTKGRIRKGMMKERSPGRWWLKATVGMVVDKATGEAKPKYLTRTIEGTKKDAERELRALVNQIDDGKAATVNRRFTLAQWLEKWLGLIENDVSARTRQGYADMVARYVVPRIGATPLAKLTGNDIKSLLNDLQREGGKGGRALSAQTCKHVYRMLFTALAAASHGENKPIAYNPAADTKPAPVPRKDVKVLQSPDDVVRLLSVARGHRYFPAIVLALATGLRRGEVLALRWDDVDWERGLVRVTRAVEVVTGDLDPASGTRHIVCRFKETKTRRGQRAVTLPGIAIEALREHQRQQREDMLQTGARSSENLVFCDHITGAMVTPNALSKSFADMAAAAGVDITLHGLRHTHVTDLLAAGIPLKAVSERAGHSSISVTADIYGHYVDSMGAAAAMAADGPLRAALSKATDTGIDTLLDPSRPAPLKMRNRKSNVVPLNGRKIG